MEEFKELFLLIKEYIQKQRENIALGAAESMTRLFFAATIAMILLILGGIALLLASFALAFWINQVTDSAIIGFGALAGGILLLAIVFWFMRKQWVLQPIARLMVRIFLETDQTAEKTPSTPQQ